MDSVGILKTKKAEYSYLPVYNEIKDTKTIAFVVNNNSLFEDFLKYDYYRENETYPIMQQFVNLGIVEDYKIKKQEDYQVSWLEFQVLL